jgi:hypothetical protein
VKELKKGRGGVHQGLVCIKVEYDVTETSGRRSGKTYHVKRRQWVVPKTALEKIASGAQVGGERVELDEETMSKNGLTIPSAEDPKRMHEHDFVKGPHPVGKKHDDRKAQKASVKEIADYWHLFNLSNQDKVNQRLHSHPPYRNVHPVSKVHEDELSQIEHRNEQLKFEQAFHTRDTGKNWLEDPDLKISPIRLTFKGERVDGQRYSKGKKEIYVFEWYDAAFVYTGQKGYEVFTGKRPLVEAVAHVKELIEEKPVRKSLDSERSSLLHKIDKLTASDPDGKVEQSVVLNKFKSGDNEVVLAGLDGKYSVSVNGTPLLNGTDFTRAIAKYYSKIASTIESNTKSKDMALDVFGDKLLQINRSIRPLIAKLGDSKSASLLLDFDYSVIDWPFNEEFFKAELPRVMQIGMVPVGEEMGVGANATGDKPSLEKDETMSPEDTKRECQKPIEEDGNRNIAPVSIAH